MKVLVYLIIFTATINIFSKNWISFDSEMIYIRTLKTDDYKNIHNGLTLNFDIGNNLYIKSNISSNFYFNKLSKVQLELSWMYEFYFFDLHPFIGYGGGYYMLNDNNLSHLIYFRAYGGVLFHAYNIWKRLKIGTETSIYTLIGTNKYIAISVTGVFFIRIEF